MSSETVYLAWQTPETRDWLVVGALTERKDGYEFHYTNGALESKSFVPFSGMEDLKKSYISEKLFPLFHNRLLSEKRPEYPKFINWLGLDESNVSPLDILARSGALRGTDNLQMFRKIDIDDTGKFVHYFFLHGLSHLSKSAQKRVDELSIGEELFLCPDYQNNYDSEAVLVRADKPAEIVGYCPRYLSRDINRLLGYSKSLNVTVETVSEEAPTNYRLMCKIEGELHSESLNKLAKQPEFDFTS